MRLLVIGASGATGARSSMSPQSPFLRWPYATSPISIFGSQPRNSSPSAPRAISIRLLPPIVAHMLPEASSTTIARDLPSASAAIAAGGARTAAAINVHAIANAEEILFSLIAHP